MYICIGLYYKIVNKTCATKNFVILDTKDGVAEPVSQTELLNLKRMNKGLKVQNLVISNNSVDIDEKNCYFRDEVDASNTFIMSCKWEKLNCEYSSYLILGAVRNPSLPATSAENRAIRRALLYVEDKLIADLTWGIDEDVNIFVRQIVKYKSSFVTVLGKIDKVHDSLHNYLFYNNKLIAMDSGDGNIRVPLDGDGQARQSFPFGVNTVTLS